MIESLTYHRSGRVHLTTAYSGKTSEEDMQFICVDQTGHVSAKNLCNHSKEHDSFRAEAKRFNFNKILITLKLLLSTDKRKNQLK